MSILRRVVDKAVRLTALAGIGYLLVSIVVTFVTRFELSLSLKGCKCKSNTNFQQAGTRAHNWNQTK